MNNKVKDLDEKTLLQNGNGNRPVRDKINDIAGAQEFENHPVQMQQIKFGNKIVVCQNSNDTFQFKSIFLT